jgi:hypothetical protein
VQDFDLANVAFGSSATEEVSSFPEEWHGLLF